MRVIFGGLAVIGLLVVLLFVAALGFFAFDELARRAEENQPRSPDEVGEP